MKSHESWYLVDSAGAAKATTEDQGELPDKSAGTDGSAPPLSEMGDVDIEDINTWVVPQGDELTGQEDVRSSFEEISELHVAASQPGEDAFVDVAEVASNDGGEGSSGDVTDAAEMQLAADAAAEHDIPAAAFQGVLGSFMHVPRSSEQAQASEEAVQSQTFSPPTSTQAARAESDYEGSGVLEKSELPGLATSPIASVPLKAV